LIFFGLLKLDANIITDEEFDALYPQTIQQLAARHWTPVQVAKLASQFLVHKPNTRVLDIGSGAGKFCIIGAAYTKGHFTGVEQRRELVEISNHVATSLYIPNVTFVNDNITSITFNDFDAFYFYNPFHENIDMVNKIDNATKMSRELYDSYSMFVNAQLASMPLGTRVVTYFAPLDIIPGNFVLQRTLLEGALRFWERIDIGADQDGPVNHEFEDLHSQ
jgi:SAM-dependent methyltransferase